jgi:hypothetical protein
MQKSVHYWVWHRRHADVFDMPKRLGLHLYAQTVQCFLALCYTIVHHLHFFHTREQVRFGIPSCHVCFCQSCNKIISSLFPQHQMICRQNGASLTTLCKLDLKRIAAGFDNL